MKLLYKIFIVTLVLSFSACDLTDLDLLDNPNAVTPDKASVNDLYNNVQLGFRTFYNDVNGATSGMARLTAQTSSYSYQNAFTPQSFNGIWYDAYARLFPDIENLLKLAEERGLAIHAGSAKIMKAYALLALVDIFGSAVNSEALKGTEIISPKDDPGPEVYKAAEALLDEAIAQLKAAPAGTAKPTFDNFYAGSAAKWATLAKTLKLRIALTTRLVDNSAGAKIKALVAEGDLIDQASEDFQFNYGNQRNNPNSRHPFYNDSYEASDGTYMSNYYMWLLRADKTDAEGNPFIDPRIRFYFYRQTDKSNIDDKSVYSCHFTEYPDQELKPAHYAKVDPRLPYCVAWEDGYWGRDHLNNEGIPPDGPLRTVYGLYPGGGQFDDNSFTGTQKLGTTGGLGQGINPIMLASFVDFMRAEAALTLSTGEDARALLKSGMEKSINKVLIFKSLVPATLSRTVVVKGVSYTIDQLYVPTSDDVKKYVDYVLAKYDAAASADAKLDIVVKEYLIALFGNGLEAYNLYRRTGKPDNMAPALEPNPGPYIRSFFLPADHVNLNGNTSQKTLTQQVFWDTNPADFVY